MDKHCVNLIFSKLTFVWLMLGIYKVSYHYAYQRIVILKIYPVISTVVWTCSQCDICLTVISLAYIIVNICMNK